MLVLARCLLFAWDKAGEGLSDDVRRRGLNAVELLKLLGMDAELVYGLDVFPTQQLPSARGQEEASN